MGGVARDLEADRLLEHALERRDMARRGPVFQFRVAGGAERDHVVVSTVVDGQPGQRL
jgi:hypothetical protein